MMVRRSASGQDLHGSAQAKNAVECVPECFERQGHGEPSFCIRLRLPDHRTSLIAKVLREQWHKIRRNSHDDGIARLFLFKLDTPCPPELGWKVLGTSATVCWIGRIASLGSITPARRRAVRITDTRMGHGRRGRAARRRSKDQRIRRRSVCSGTLRGGADHFPNVEATGGVARG